MSLNPHRCDNCIKNHKKCDRKVPNCSLCQIKGFKCLYTKTFQYKKRFKELEGNLSKFSLENYKCKSPGEIPNEQFKTIKLKFSKSTISNVPAGFGKDSTPLSVIYKIPRLFLLENLMTLIQCPSPYKQCNSHDLFLKLVVKLGIHIKRSPAKHVKNEVAKPVNLELHTTIISAIKSFFLHTNVIFPLFIEEAFDFMNKTFELRLAIIACGLAWMEQNESTEYILSYISSVLQKRLMSLFDLKVSFETMQTVLLLITGIRIFHWVAANLQHFINFCYKASDALGLSFQNVKDRRKKQIEKILAYNCVTMLQTHFTFLTGTIMHWPNKPKSLNSLYTKFIPIINQKHILDLNSIHIYCTYLLSSFYYELSCLFFSIRLLKSRYILSNSTIEQLKKITSIILIKVKNVQTHYLHLFNIIDPNFVEKVVYSDFISFTCHHLKFFIYSLNLYEGLNISSNFYNEMIKKALNECHSTIKHGVNLPGHFMLVYGVSNIAQCLIFLFRYKNYSLLSCQNSIDKGMKYLELLGKFPCLSLLSKLNLHLYKTVGESHK